MYYKIHMQNPWEILWFIDEDLGLQPKFLCICLSSHQWKWRGFMVSRGHFFPLRIQGPSLWCFRLISHLLSHEKLVRLQLLWPGSSESVYMKIISIFWPLNFPRIFYLRHVILPLMRLHHSLRCQWTLASDSIRAYFCASLLTMSSASLTQSMQENVILSFLVVLNLPLRTLLNEHRTTQSSLETLWAVITAFLGCDVFQCWPNPCFAHTCPRRKDRRGVGWEEWFHPTHLHPTWLTVHLGEHGVVTLIEIGESINWEYPLGQLSQKAPGRGRQGPSEDCLTHGVKPEREWMTTLGTSYRDVQGKGWLSLSLWMGSGIVVRTQMNRSCHTGPSTPKSWW